MKTGINTGINTGISRANNNIHGVIDKEAVKSKERPGMHSKIRLSAIMLSIVLGTTGCTSVIQSSVKSSESVLLQNESTMKKEAVMLEKAFTLPNISGSTVNLSDFSGKKVYVKFWATWCPICLAGIKDLETFAQEQKASKDIVVLTIVSPGANGEMKSDDFKKWFEKQGYQFEVLLDDGGKVAKDFSVRGYPTSFIFNTDGTIALSRTGHVENADLVELLNKAQ